MPQNLSAKKSSWIDRYQRASTALVDRVSDLKSLKDEADDCGYLEGGASMLTDDEIQATQPHATAAQFNAVVATFERMRPTFDSVRSVFEAIRP